MNRLQLSPPPSYSSQQSTSQRSAQLYEPTFTTTHDSGTPHSVFAPLHYEPNYAYPLLIWLHGPDDDERQLQRVMPLVSMRNYVGIGPRGTRRSELDPRGYCWRQTERDIALAEDRVLDCVRLAGDRFNIAPSRVFLGGYDCGGTMAFRIGLRNPREFAGILSAGGPFPSELTPLANYHQARQVPLFIAQGLEAENYSAAQKCRELRLFHAASFKVNVRQYPCGDELTTQMLHDMDVWMMEHVTGLAASSSTTQP